MSELVPALRRHYTLAITSFDVAAWLLAYSFFAVLRFSETTVIPWSAVLLAGLGSGVLHLLVGLSVRLHHGRARTASLEEMISLGLVTIVTGGIVFAINLSMIWVPRSAPLAATFLAVVIMAGGRGLWRRARERDAEAQAHDASTRTIVIGAGEAGRELIASMLRDPARRWQPVALVDDDPAKRRRRIRNVPVLGTTQDLARVVERTGADSAVIAIPSATGDDISRLSALAHDAGVDVKVLPAPTQLLSDHVGIRDIRDINLADVLGRSQLDTDVSAIAGYLTGRRVLVTGAGGSIGSELCRQIHGFGPSELMMLDRDESALHAVQLSIHGRALLDSDDVILCDIRDAGALNAIFEERQPEVVFHAAALKHLPMLEQFPAEAVKTNVIGTRNVLQASQLVGVDKFVNISTDKAANPSSVLGYSKRVAERVTADHAAIATGTYLSVRFGNVLGSRGSVLTAFARQIAAGGPVTVTDPDVTRYFMTIEEACQLTIQAAAIGRAGEALVLEMGEPVRIIDVANQLIRQSGRQIPVEFTGLRQGEKLHEELFADDEPRDVRPAHPMVSHVPVSRVSHEEVESLPRAGSAVEVTRALASLCLEWQRS